MTSEFLLDAIGQMDDELVTEAAQPIRRPTPWLKVSGLAAALLLCVGLGSLAGVMPWNGAGAAAPESGMLLGDVMLDQDAAAEDYEYRSEQESKVETPSAANKAESTTADGATGGFMEPKFFTRRGVYFLIGEEFPYKPKLPDTEQLNRLGNLNSAVPGKQVYPSTGTQEYVGCPVWESTDGNTLYIELPDGGCLVATLYE